jgi:hypothetical protein
MPTDQDGKSKTASAVDADSYPEQNEVDASASPVTAEEVRRRAHELWVERGQQEGEAERDWADAESELQRKGPRADLDRQRNKTGSVQR